MKIFVTGATGFIGRAFCRVATARGHRVLALTRDNQAAICAGVEIAVGSLANTPWSTVQRFAPDAALHLAWIAEPGVYLTSPENALWLEQSKIWFQHLLKLGTPYITGTGTCIEYAAAIAPLNEEHTPLDPQSPYAKAKTALYEWLRDNGGGQWSWLRIFYPYGAGEHPNRFCSSMIRQFHAGKPVMLNTPDSVRDYIQVDDVAAGLCHVIETGATGAINVGTGNGITIESLARHLVSLLGSDEKLIQKNPAAGPDPLPKIVADASRLMQTGWRPQVSISDGLQRLIDSMPLRT